MSFESIGKAHEHHRQCLLLAIVAMPIERSHCRTYAFFMQMDAPMQVQSMRDTVNLEIFIVKIFS